MEVASLRSLFEQVLAGTSGRMVVLGQTPFMFAAVNDNSRASLFIRVSLAPSQVVSDGQGFSVSTTRSGSNDYVQITASDGGLPQIRFTDPRTSRRAALSLRSARHAAPYLRAQARP